MYIFLRILPNCLKLPIHRFKNKTSQVRKPMAKRISYGQAKIRDRSPPKELPLD